MQEKELLREIEKSRWEMIHLADKHLLSSVTLLQVSRKLDLLLNQYYQMYRT